MKANENLMVGDWVKFKGSDLYHQVKVVSNKSIKFDNQKWFAKSSAESIPLIPEILEKNGFEYKAGEFGMYGIATVPHYVRNDVPFEIFCDGEPFAIWFKEPINIKYVHQLQHALRLCGIEKEIVL
jgi:hypothetical protein